MEIYSSVSSQIVKKKLKTTKRELKHHNFILQAL